MHVLGLFGLGPVFFSNPEAVAAEVEDPRPSPKAEAARPNLQMVVYQLCLFLSYPLLHIECPLSWNLQRKHKQFKH